MYYIIHKKTYVLDRIIIFNLSLCINQNKNLNFFLNVTQKKNLQISFYIWDNYILVHSI